MASSREDEIETIETLDEAPGARQSNALRSAREPSRLVTAAAIPSAARPNRLRVCSSKAIGRIGGFGSGADGADGCAPRNEPMFRGGR
jgi:hypothetical protein